LFKLDLSELFIFGLNSYYVLNENIEEIREKFVKDLVIKLQLPRINLDELDVNQKSILPIIYQNGNKLDQAIAVLHEKL